MGNPSLRLLSASHRGEDPAVWRPAPSPHLRAAVGRREAGHPEQSPGAISRPKALSAGRTPPGEFSGLTI